MLTRTTFALIACSVAALILGCKPKDEVQVYSVPRTSASREPLDAELVAGLLDHTLVAIVAQGDKAWFFKLAGPAKAIDRQREAFLEFLAGVKLADQSSDNPSWQVPEAWQERPASEMRLATLVVPDEQGPLEVAVSSLPYSGDWKAFLVPNVNRWLRQLQEPPLDEETILELTQQVELQNGTATVVELVGRMPKQNSSNPHAGIPGAPPIGDSQPAQPPPASTASKASKALTYETPAGWLPGELKSMRKAAFLVTDGDAQAEITVIDLPSAGGEQVTSVEANMRRWAGQVGLADLEADALQTLIQPIEIDGSEGSYGEFVSPEAAEQQSAIFAAMIVRGDKVWFFKMSGDVAVVKAQRDAFRKFLESVKFEETAE